LERVEPGDMVKTYHNPNGMLAFSHTNLLAVGSMRGYIRVIGLPHGKTLWKRKIPEASITDIFFFKDYLLVGEKSRDAYLYCFNGKTGEKLWRYKTARELGEVFLPINKSEEPKVARIAVDTRGIAWVTVSMYHKGKKDGKEHFFNASQILCFDITTGKCKHRFQGKGHIDSRPYWIEVTADGKYVVFGNWKTSETYPGAAYCLSGETGEELWKFVCKPLVNWDIGTWMSPSVSNDGKYAVVYLYDGRAFLFDNQEMIRSKGKALPLWEKNISTPVNVGGVPVYGSPNISWTDGEEALFSVGTSYVCPGARKVSRLPPIEHPNSNTILVYDRDGKLKWKWNTGGYTQRIHISPEYLAVPVAQNILTKQTKIHGVYLFDRKTDGSATEKLLWFYRVEGIAIDAAVSPDGRYVAVLEAPIDIEPGRGRNVIGEYRLHILI